MSKARGSLDRVDVKNLDEDVVSIEHFEEAQEQKAAEERSKVVATPPLVFYPDSLDFQKKTMQQRSEAKQEPGFRRIIPTPPSDASPADAPRPAIPKLSRRHKGRSKRGPKARPDAQPPSQAQAPPQCSESASGAPSFLVSMWLTS